MDKNTIAVKDLEFVKFVKTNFNKLPSELCPWEYREALSFFTYSKVGSSQSLSLIQLDKICESIINNIDYSWTDLTLVDEAEIQKQLRKRGYELRCFELNTFPIDSQSLNKLLIKSKITSNFKEKWHSLILSISWNGSWLTPILIISLLFANINVWQTLLVAYILAAALSTLGHNYILHNTNLTFKNKVLEFIGLVLLYFYVFDVRPGGRAYHTYHHRLWRTNDDPLVNDMKTNVFFYILSYPNRILQQNSLLHNHYADEPEAQPTFNKYLLEYRWRIFFLVVVLWIGIFGFSNWVAFHLIPMWAISVIYSKSFDVIFHGPHTWENYSREKDIPWLMPIMFGSAFHITHHIYPNDLYFGPGKSRYFNLEYWLTLFFFDVSKTKIRY